MRKVISAVSVSFIASLVSLSALAGFTTSEFGKGKFVDGSSVGDIINNMTCDGGADCVDMTDIADLAAAFDGASSLSYADNSTLAIFDQNNDGSISEQEFVDILAGMASISGVNTSGGGKYAQAYATELGAMASPITVAKIQAAITAGNSYAVDSPQITVANINFLGTDSSHSSSLGLIDGLGNSVDNASGSCSSVLTATDSDGDNATSNFQITDGGALALADNVSIQDLDPGTYTISVTSTDTNTSSYNLAAQQDVSLTISNERGCIINNGIVSSNFSAGDNTSSITGATVTISGNHEPNDLLFIRNATKSTTSDNISYSNFGVSGIAAVFDKTSGELTFSGSTTLDNWITIFKKVGYIFDSDNSTDNGTRSLIFSLSNRIPYNHTDGKVHFYKYIEADDINFETALIQAKSDAKKLFGLQGYLATVTSAAEQTYIEPKINGQGWLGACDRLDNTTIRGYCGVADNETGGLTGRPWSNSNGSVVFTGGEGYWYWVSGPERLDYIGRDTGNCKNINQQKSYAHVADTGSFDDTNSEQTYTNFRSCEPNNYLSSSATGGGENMLHFYSDGGWNDYSHSSNKIDGYLMEWGGMDGDPDLVLTVDKNYNIDTEGQFCAY